MILWVFFFFHVSPETHLPTPELCEVITLTFGVTPLYLSHIHFVVLFCALFLFYKRNIFLF